MWSGPCISIMSLALSHFSYWAGSWVYEKFKIYSDSELLDQSLSQKDGLTNRKTIQPHGWQVTDVCLMPLSNRFSTEIVNLPNSRNRRLGKSRI
ncbi:hypothetical protein SeLEV6574_g00962 [Synchytrium endobioticum]|uniref:Uncharacterized protein n=1 Tax=Synchytrium endobioticum TaxID=286115 RepID=A0A507DHG7_9FUNG|nr:hypothetical protein SeLEV6574_g00962 [Synchytrium endobioticum]